MAVGQFFQCLVCVVVGQSWFDVSDDVGIMLPELQVKDLISKVNEVDGIVQLQLNDADNIPVAVVGLEAVGARRLQAQSSDISGIVFHPPLDLNGIIFAGIDCAPANAAVGVCFLVPQFDEERRLNFVQLSNKEKVGFFVVWAICNPEAWPIIGAIGTIVAVKVTFDKVLPAGCIAGTTEYKLSEGTKTLDSINEGELIPGVDFYGHSSLCKVSLKLHVEKPLYDFVYGNYTSDHYMFENNEVVTTAHGNVAGLNIGDVRYVRVYDVLTENCVAITDTTGTHATAFTSTTCQGSLSTFGELVAATKALNAIHMAVGTAAFESKLAQNLTVNATTTLCHDLVQCALDAAKCTQLTSDAAPLLKYEQVWEKFMVDRTVQGLVGGIAAENHTHANEFNTVTAVLLVTSCFMAGAICAGGAIASMWWRTSRSGSTSVKIDSETTV